MDLFTITEIPFFTEAQIKNLTDLQTFIGTLTMIAAPLWGCYRAYKFFFGNKPKLKVSSIGFSSSSPEDQSSFDQVLLTNCSTSKSEITKIEIVFLRKKERFTLEVWKSGKKPLLLNPEESSAISIEPISCYSCDNVICDISDLWFERNYFLKIYTVTGGTIETSFSKQKCKKYRFRRKKDKTITSFRSYFGEIVYGLSWSHLLSVKQGDKVFAGFLKITTSHLTLINIADRKEHLIYLIKGLKEQGLREDLTRFFQTTFPNSTFDLYAAHNVKKLDPVRL